MHMSNEQHGSSAADTTATGQQQRAAGHRQHTLHPRYVVQHFLEDDDVEVAVLSTCSASTIVITHCRMLSSLLFTVIVHRRGHLRSSTSSLLDVRPSRCVTVGDRSFATAGPRLWNSQPADVRSASSLTILRRKLKTHLFRQSYPDIVL